MLTKSSPKTLLCCPSYVLLGGAFFFLKCLSFLNPLISNIGLSIIYNSPLTSNFFLKFLRNKVFSPFTKSFRKISWKVNEIPTKWISFIIIVNRNARFALLNLSSAKMKIGFWLSRPIFNSIQLRWKYGVSTGP